MAKLANFFDFAKNEARNMLLHVLASAPGSPTEAQVYYNSTDKHPYYRTNAAWKDFTDALLLNGQTSAYHLARANHSGTQVAATVSDFDTQVRLSRLDQMANPTASINFNTQKGINVLAGTNPGDLVNFAQLEAARQGIRSKYAVEAVATTNISVASPGTAVFDDITLANGERLLLPVQSTDSEDGIYIFNGSGSALTRADDADTFGELDAGTDTFAQGGTANGGKVWRQLTELTALGGQVWSPVSAATTYTAGDGMTESPAGTFNVATASSGRIVVSANDIDLASGIATPGTYGSVTVDTYGRVTGGTNPSTAGKYSALVGDGAATSFVITTATHGRAADRTNLVQILEESSGEVVLADVTLAANGDVTVAFSVIPTTNQYRVTIIG